MKKINYSSLRESIRVLVRSLDILEKNEASTSGITLAQCHAIVEIGRAEQITLNDLSNLLGLDKSTMSRTVNKLVEDGLVSRESNSEDRRFLSIKLTDKGRKIYEDIEKNMESYYEKILEWVPEDKRKQVLESLEILNNAVESKECDSVASNM